MFDGHGGDIFAKCDSIGVDAATVLDVSASLSAWPLPDMVKEAYQAAFSDIGRYPSADADVLRAAVADTYNCDVSTILAGAGTTEFIYLLAQVLRPKKIWAFAPTYADYADAARVMDIAYEAIPTLMSKDFSRNLDLCAEKIKANEMLVLCNPNNPTGHLLLPGDILGWARRHPDVTVVIDEAYAEFIGESASCINLSRPDNVIILQSPTKFYGMPGLRLGYCFASAEKISRLRSAKMPWTVSAPAMAVGRALLLCHEYAELVRKRLAIVRPEFIAQLSAISGLHVYQTTANFLLCRIEVPELTASVLQDGCLSRGILIRDASNFSELDDKHVRLAIRDIEDNVRVCAALCVSMERYQ
jgi:threonine-phosphate decarboxylase